MAEHPAKGSIKIEHPGVTRLRVDRYRETAILMFLNRYGEVFRYELDPPEIYELVSDLMAVLSASKH